jgi:hypothetical protein
LWVITPLNWPETGESQVFGPDINKEAEEQVQLIRKPFEGSPI